MGLHERRCVPCRGGIPPMDEETARAWLAKVPGWELVDAATKIARRFAFPDFLSAQRFAVAAGELAEEENHHPDICYGWGWCRIVFYTHKIGGLHENDFIMAAKVDALWERAQR